MRWRGERQSTNIEDRRGMSGGRGIAVGGGLGTLVIMILALLFGFDPQTLLQQSPDNQPTQVQTSRPQNSEEEELKQFVAVVLAKSEDVWGNVFRQNGRQYREPTLVLFLTRCARLVESRARRLDRSTVLVTRRSTSILPSTKNCAGNLVRLEILRRRTSSRMK